MQEKIELQKKIELDPKEVLSIMMLLNSVITATALKEDNWCFTSDEIYDMQMKLQAKFIAVMQGTEE